MKPKIWIHIVANIQWDLVNTLVACKATFEANISKNSFFILDVVYFNLDESNSDAMYCIRIDTENNTKDIFIAKENILEFTVHFQPVLPNY